MSKHRGRKRKVVKRFLIKNKTLTNLQITLKTNNNCE